MHRDYHSALPTSYGRPNSAVETSRPDLDTTLLDYSRERV